MSIIATIMNSATGQPIQKMKFNRMPKPWASFTLETGEMVTAERIDIGKPAPGKFAAPIDIWVTPKTKAYPSRVFLNPSHSQQPRPKACGLRVARRCVRS